MRNRLTTLALVLTIAVAACGGGDDDADGPDPTAAPPPPASGDAAAGETAFQGTCSACHGTDLMGVTGLGKPLIGSDYFNTRSDSEMVEFLKVGRPTSDPLNTTGVDMPPRGGNPSLTDDDLLDIVAFVRSRN